MTYPDLTQAHGPCSGRPGGWCDFSRGLASETWRYAQLSTNAYCSDTVPFDLPEGTEEVGRQPRIGVCEAERAAARGKGKPMPPARADKAKGKAGADMCAILAAAQERSPTMEEEDPALEGFSYALFDQANPGGGPPTRVIAFRGTDFTQLDDWIHGNIGRDQTAFARCLYKQQREELGPDHDIVLTGHSLGGALALQISLDQDLGVAPPRAVYVFDTSPRYFFDSTPSPVRRVAVVERGEILSLLREHSPTVRQDLFVVNCRPWANAVRNHAMRPLAECLTWIAAREQGGATAGVPGWSVKANCIEAPDGELANAVWGLSDGPQRQRDLRRKAKGRKFEGCRMQAGV